jgi:peroxiredoxin Q/BCP
MKMKRSRMKMKRSSLMATRTLSVGQAAPTFALKTVGERTITLSDFRGKNVVLYFYPKDDTPGCTKEACGFRDDLSRFTKGNAVVLGVSRDNPASHQRFADKLRLTFPLLSDPDAAVCKAYGVYKQKSMYGRTYWGIERTTFVIDEQGRIAKIFPKVGVDGHTEAVLEALRPSTLRRGPRPLAVGPLPRPRSAFVPSEPRVLRPQRFASQSEALGACGVKQSSGASRALQLRSGLDPERRSKERATYSGSS